MHEEPTMKHKLDIVVIVLFIVGAIISVYNESYLIGSLDSMVAILIGKIRYIKIVLEDILDQYEKHR